jgi:hypothetical protein
MNIFNQINVQKPSSNTFDLTHDRKVSTTMGRITPIMVMDCVPGDKINIKGNAMVRFAPMVTPVMHRVNVYLHYFFVPNRILWNNWEKFITGGDDGTADPIAPYVEYQINTQPASSLADYLGLPVGGDQLSSGQNPVITASALPFAAYAKIYNDYYRDQNLQNEVNFELIDGQVSGAQLAALSVLRNRAWHHDYFTSALPFTQKGPEALLPIGGQAPVVAWLDPLKNPQTFRATGTNIPQSSQNVTSDAAGSILASGGNSAFIDLEDSHYADLSAATATSIIELRRAFKLQEWLEKNARGGSRYTESILVHFGVQSSDKRLQRAEYIGGSKSPVKISEVLNTTGTQDAPQGTMAGHGVSVGGSNTFSYFAEEHGYIIGLMSVIPMTAYQQGIPRHFSRFNRFDYYWPEFAHIGEQAILNQELGLVQSSTQNEGTFGYTPRYSEYKYMMNTVHGDFKISLDRWHMGRKFTGSAPIPLAAKFIECDNEEVERIFAVTGNLDNLWCHILNEVKATRLMPVFGNPRIT